MGEKIESFTNRLRSGDRRIIRQLSPLFALIVFIGLAFASDLNGTYKGTWASDNQGGGGLTMSFSGDSSSLEAEVSFTTEGETVKCHVKSVKLDGSKLLLVMDYGEGDRHEAIVSGVLHGKLLSGTYKTKSLADDSPGDTGTWKSTKGFKLWRERGHRPFGQPWIE